MKDSFQYLCLMIEYYYSKICIMVLFFSISTIYLSLFILTSFVMFVILTRFSIFYAKELSLYSFCFIPILSQAFIAFFHFTAIYLNSP